MATSARSSAHRRRGGVQRSLSEDQIVDTALALTRDLGLDGLSVARLARELGVGDMTLYSYFRSRAELLAAMARRAAVDLYDGHVDRDGVEWDEALRAHYLSIRASLKTHPALADLLFFHADELPGSQEMVSQELLRIRTDHIERHIDAMIRGGVEAALAVRAFYGLSNLTLAAALREAEPHEAGPDGPTWSTSSWGAAGVMLRAGTPPSGTLPDVRFASDEQFALMLDLMLAGIRSTITPTPGRRRR